MPALPWGVLPAEHLEAVTPHEPNPESEEVWRLAQGAEASWYRALEAMARSLYLILRTSGSHWSV